MIPEIHKHKSVVPKDIRSDLPCWWCCLNCFCGGKTMRTFGVLCNKLLSLIGVTRQTHVSSPVRQVMWSHPHVLWQPARKNLSVLQVTAGNAVSTIQRNVRLHGDVKTKGTILSVRYTLLSVLLPVFVRPGRCVSSTSVILLPEALYHIQNWHHGCFLPVYRFFMNLQQC